MKARQVTSSVLFDASKFLRFITVMVSAGVGNKTLFERYYIVQTFLEKNSVFQWLYLGIFVSFFAFDTSNHRLYLYVFVMPVFLVFARWGLVRKVIELPFWRLSAFYLVYLWATQFWSVEPSLVGILNQTRLLFIVLFFITVTLYLLKEDPGFPDRILRYFGWAGAIGAAGAVGYHLIFIGDLGARMAGPGRAEHVIIGATLYGVAALCLLGTVLRDTQHSRIKVLGWGAFLLLIFAMLLTHSRGPVLIIGCVIVVYLFATGRWKIAIFIPLAAVTYVALLMAGVAEPVNWIERGSTHRIGIWLQSWELISANLKSLLVGQGVLTDYAFKLSNGGFVKSPHSLFIANQLYGGLVATVLLFGLIAVALINAMQGFRKSGNFVVCALLLFGLGVSLFDYRTVLINLSHEWVSFWLPVLLAAIGWPQKSQAPQK